MVGRKEWKFTICFEDGRMVIAKNGKLTMGFV